MPDPNPSQQQLITNRQQTQEYQRLLEDQNRAKYWKRWGPYVSDRQWGTVREDYSEGGGAWDDFSHDQARSRAYRWGEDGIMGISDNHQRLCFAIALWNENDPILKERLYGLTGAGSHNLGNHGEDVKEYYFYLANTPTHSYMQGLYKYPHAAYPYETLNQKGKIGKDQPEFELLDTKIFEENRYFDVFVEYAKSSPEDILIKISITNRGPETKRLHLAPALWFRNTWAWGYPDRTKPSIKEVLSNPDFTVLEANFNDSSLEERGLNQKWLYCEKPDEVLYTENESNRKELNWASENPTGYFKDGIHKYVTQQDKTAVNPNKMGTKIAPYYKLDIAPGATQVIRLRLSDVNNLATPFGSEFDSTVQARQREADDFYQAINPFSIPDDMRHVQKQAFAGMLWSKQFYHYVVYDWLQGDPVGPPPPQKRKERGSRNVEWQHLFNEDILSMPDKWEYPWFAAWDLAFHTVTFALIDPTFAKNQLRLLTREWYMHPNGQMPAYEWAFGDVNPPVHAWAAWRVYKIEAKMFGTSDRAFLEEIFQKLSLYFTWWTNRKDPDGQDIFGGGFLGLDNIGPIDRSHLKDGDSIAQSDGTAWMAMYCLNMLEISLELAIEEPEYEVMACKFFQHFLLIADAMNKIGGNGVDIWDSDQQFYRDILKIGNWMIPINLRSMVGLIPLFAVTSITADVLEKLLSNEFKKRFDWFIANRQDLTQHENIVLTFKDTNPGVSSKKDVFLALVSPQARLKPILKRMLDTQEFLSDYGIRALSKTYENNPYALPSNDKYSGQVKYEPAESSTDLFGGNSNWRGPVWFPVNFLIIESLQKFNFFLGNDFTVEYPTGSGQKKTLWEVSSDLSYRLIKIFLKDNEQRPVYGGGKTWVGAKNQFQADPNWQDHILFYEYFHGDNGAGIGASHQTGWTGVVAKLIQQYGEYATQGQDPDTL